MSLGQTWQEKSKADELWLSAASLEDEDESEKRFAKAFELYKDVHKQLPVIEVAAQSGQPYTSEALIQLYYIYKTLAMAYFMRHEFNEAIVLFDRALKHYEQHQAALSQEVLPEHIRGIRFNIASARFELIYAEEYDPSNAAQVLSIVDAFCDDLLAIRQYRNDFNHTANKAIDYLFQCHQWLSGLNCFFESELQKQKIFWMFKYVLTKDQMIDLIAKSQFQGELNINKIASFVRPALSPDQVFEINQYTPPPTALDEDIGLMLQKMDRFEKSDDFAKLKLYPHQKIAIEQFKTHLSKGFAKGYFIAATGAGKTRIFLSKIIASDSPALILVPSKALVEQTKTRLEELLKELGIRKTIGKFTGESKNEGDITIITNASLKSQMNRPKGQRTLKLERYPLVVLDEAHLSLTAKAKSLVDELALSKVVIGCTATEAYNVKRKDEDLRTVAELFGDQNCYFRYPMLQAVEDKVLCPVHICMVTTNESLRWIRPKSKSGRNKDISEREAAERINNDKLNEVIAEIYANAIHPNTGKRIFGKVAIAFCAGIEHAEAIAKKFNELFKDDPYLKAKGMIPAAAISGKISAAEQKKLLEDYSQGKIALMCSADLLVTGVDNPNIEVAFNLRPTRSIVMALQRAGRVVRTSKSIPDKVALIFEFNWVVPGQVFVQHFLNDQYQLGTIAQALDENTKFEVLRREEVTTKFPNAAPWEINWRGDVRHRTVGTLRRHVETKVQSHTGMLPNTPVIVYKAGQPQPQLDSLPVDDLPQLSEEDISYLLGDPAVLAAISSLQAPDFHDLNELPEPTAEEHQQLHDKLLNSSDLNTASLWEVPLSFTPDYKRSFAEHQSTNADSNVVTNESSPSKIARINDKHHMKL